MASESKWKIKIKTLKADTFELEVNSDSTVDTLKQEIEKFKSIIPSLQRLIFKGQILKSSTKLKDYKICNGSTIHLVVRKASGTTSTNHSQNTSSANHTQNTAPNTAPNAMPFNNLQQHQQAQINAIQAMFSNLSGGGNPPPAAGGNASGGAAPHPQMVIRRMPMKSSSSNTIRNVHDADEEEKDAEEAIEIKKAECDTETDANLLKWKLKRVKLQNWIKTGPKYACYFSDEQQLNNGSIWRFFMYPNGINQGGYHEDTVLFIMLEQLPFGVQAMDIEFALHFAALNVHFKFRKTFNHFVRSAGWPRNFLLMSKVLEVPQNKQCVKLTCDLVVHSVIVEGKRMTNEDYVTWKGHNPLYDEGVSKKPDSRLFRWKLDKKMFIDAQFKQYQQSKTFEINGFKFYVQTYPNGLARNGFVQPYLHLVKMPPSVNKIDAHFTFYFREINVGYSHVDTFNGKMGKGWPEMRLKREHVKWNDLKSITMDCRVNILNISVNATGWFVRHLGLKKTEEENECKEDAAMNNGGHVESERDKEKQQRLRKEELKRWLCEDELGKYFDRFVENEIRSLDDVVEYIEDPNNLKEIGVKPFGHRVKIWKNILKLQEIRQMQNDDEASIF
eukprot:100001_1